MIERRRTSLICLHDDKVLGFHAQDPTDHTKYFFLPGGKIEEGETPAQATLRETLEETGYEAEILPGFEYFSAYPFHWDGKDYLSKTIFYAGRLKNAAAAPATVDDESYHRGVAWIPVSDIDQVFAYNSEILTAVKATLTFLESH